MKNLLITFVVLLMSFTMMSQTIENRSIYNVDKFIADCLTELNVTNDSVTVVVMSYNKVKPCTVVTPLLRNHYMIFISNDYDYTNYIRVLAHELVHVKQFVNNEFEYNTIARFSETYDTSYKYDIRFEEEAHKLGGVLIGKCLKIKL